MKYRNDEKIFLNWNYLLLWCGQLFSTIGNWIYSMFILIFVASLTDKAIIVSGMLMTSMIPNILFGPIIGNIVDKLNKKYVIVASDFLRGILLLLMLPVIERLNDNHTALLIFIFIISIVSNTVGNFFDPAARAILPKIYSKDIKKANSYFSLIGSVSLVLGPAFGGTLVGLLGFKGVIIFNACTFLVSAVSELFIGYIEEMQEEQTESLNMIEKYKLGWSAMSKNTEIKYYVIIAGARSLVVGLVNISFVFVAGKVFAKGSESVGYIYMSLGCGLILGSLLIAYWKYEINDIKLYLYVIWINAAVSVIYIFTHSPVFVLVSLFIVGMSDGIQSVLLYSNIQNKVDSKDIGKVVACTNSTMMFFQLASMSFGGIFFDYFNSAHVILIVAIIVIIWAYMYYLKVKRV